MLSPAEAPVKNKYVYYFKNTKYILTYKETDFFPVQSSNSQSRKQIYSVLLLIVIPNQKKMREC